jgi:hypothetical protein
MRIVAWALAVTCLIAFVPVTAQQQSRRSVAEPRNEVAPWIRRGQPGEGHRILRTLAGHWRVEKSL